MVAKELNVVLLTVDALRADHCSHHGYARDTSPHLEEWASKGATFTTAISASSHTREAMPALLAGKHPVDACTDTYELGTESIATALNRHGYTTGGFHSNPYLSRTYGFGNGFDEFYDDLLIGRHRSVALLQRLFDKLRDRHFARAEQINDRSISWLDTVQEPFFLWNHYMDVHGPYEPPQTYRDQFCDTSISDRRCQWLFNQALSNPDEIDAAERQLLIDLYDSEINYIDDHLAEFLRTLEHRGVLERTLVIITADHGDAFGEHGYYVHPRYLHEEVLHVPLIVIGPDIPTYTDETPVSTVDIVPTIAEITDCDTSDYPGTSLTACWSQERTHPGKAFASARSDENPHCRFVLRNDRWKYHLTRHLETGNIIDRTLYDMEIDPNEQSDKNPDEIRASHDQIATLERELEEHSEHWLNNGDVDETADEIGVSSAVQRRLEKLGYK